MRAGLPALHCPALHCPTLCLYAPTACTVLTCCPDMLYSTAFPTMPHTPSAQQRPHHCARLLISIAVITMSELGTSTHHAVIVCQRSHTRVPKPLHNVANPSPYAARPAAGTASLICLFVEVLCAATPRNDLKKMQNCTAHHHVALSCYA